MRLIDADEFYRILENKATMDEVCLLSHIFSLKELAYILHTMPEIEAERPKGKWKYKFVCPPVSCCSSSLITCTECYYSRQRVDGEILNYCPNCGADMRGGK